jgi:hypothetical protein
MSYTVGMEIPQKYLPSKAYLKNLGTLVVAIVAVIALGKTYMYAKSYIQSRLSGSSVAVAPIIVKDLAMQDENKNGIPDWQDNLSASLPAPSASQTTQAPINETEQFARDLVTTAATISQSGTLSDQGAQQIASQVTNQIAAATVGETFTTTDIKVIADTKASEAAYVKQVTNILNVQYPLDIDNSVTILQSALATGDASSLAALVPISDRYEKLIQTFKALPVPSSFADNHLAFINILGKVHGSIETMRNTFTNPVMAMSVIMNYTQTVTDLLSYISPFTTKQPYSTVATDTTSIGSVNQ